MKATANHPHYKPSKVTCSCGAEYETFSTRGDFGVDVCSACHPFYTGKQKLLDTAGRVERFKKKYRRGGKKKQAAAAAAPAAEPEKAAADEPKADATPTAE